MRIDMTIVYSLITRPLIVAVKEMAEWGITRDQIEEELRYALSKGLKDSTENKDKSDAGH